MSDPVNTPGVADHKATGSGVAGAMYVDKTTFDVYVWRAD